LTWESFAASQALQVSTAGGAGKQFDSATNTLRVSQIHRSGAPSMIFAELSTSAMLLLGFVAGVAAVTGIAVFLGRRAG
jgi:hypothetical protein